MNLSTQSIAEFSDGMCFLEYDARADDKTNAALTAALIVEGRRRAKAGLSDVSRIRLRTDFDAKELKELFAR